MDLAEVILKWELQRIKDDQEQTATQEVKISCVLNFEKFTYSL